MATTVKFTPRASLKAFLAFIVEDEGHETFADAVKSLIVQRRRYEEERRNAIFDYSTGTFKELNTITTEGFIQ